MLAWIKWIVKEHRTIAAFVIFILSITGISIYGNVNEFNPWTTAVEELTEEKVPDSEPSLLLPTPIPQIKIIETRVESGLTKQDVKAAMAAHIEEFH